MVTIYNAGEVLTIIRALGQNDVEDLGANETAQNTIIFQLMNVAMMKNARLFNQVKYSDSLTISSDGYVTFKQDGVNISNMFEPSTIFGPNGATIQKRTSDEAPKGWYRAAENQEIHIRGFSLASQPLTAGAYQLKYIKYPKRVTLSTDTLEAPPSGYDALIKDTLALLKLARNSYSGSEYMDAKAKQSYGALAQAAMSAGGTGTSGQPISAQDVTIARGG